MKSKESSLPLWNRFAILAAKYCDDVKLTVSEIVEFAHIRRDLEVWPDGIKRKLWLVKG